MCVAAAIKIAYAAHAGQLDKQGRNYFDYHLIPVAEVLRPYGAEAEAAGYLHDVLEDTAVTVPDLVLAGIPKSVVNAVVACTRLEGEPYEALIWRAKADPLGRLVKLADNWVNLTGLDGIEDEATRVRLKVKYLNARRVLGAY
jgi:(p)ppGpp synthase/HD superfamily hydrolase